MNGSDAATHEAERAVLAAAYAYCRARSAAFDLAREGSVREHGARVAAVERATVALMGAVLALVPRSGRDTGVR